MDKIYASQFVNFYTCTCKTCMCCKVKALKKTNFTVSWFSTSTINLNSLPLLRGGGYKIFEGFHLWINLFKWFCTGIFVYLVHKFLNWKWKLLFNFLDLYELCNYSHFLWGDLLHKIIFNVPYTALRKVIC
jgi:hypothetical protein